MTRDVIVRHATSADVVVALLADLDFTAFVEEEGGVLHAYGPADAIDVDAVRRVLSDRVGALGPVTVDVRDLADENWNARWESDFKPIRVGDVSVRADFHAPVPEAVHDIVIHPGMAFGTGHHDTTSGMIEALSTLDPAGRSVLDMGCGTGVLAILAARMGARRVVAVDNDPLATEASEHNARRNEASVEVRLDDTVPAERFDIILANITLNVLVDAMNDLSEALQPGGRLVCSGILHHQLDELHAAMKRSGLILGIYQERGDWMIATAHAPKPNA